LKNNEQFLYDDGTITHLRRTSVPNVKVRIGEPIDKALRALKKKLDKEGIMKAAKAHRFYDKPSVKKRAKSKAARKRAKTVAKKQR